MTISIRSTVLAVLFCMMTVAALAPGALAQGSAMANLKITKVTISPEPSEVGKLTTVEVNLENQGTVNITDFNVTFIDEQESTQGKPTGTNMIERMTGGTNKTVVFVWMPMKSGSHKLRFSVDPDNRISETNENDNIVSQVLVVKASSVTPPSPCGGIFIISLACVAVPWMRRRPWSR